MTPQREEPGADHWQNEPLFLVVLERNFAAQRTTLRLLLIAAIVLPCLYVAVMAWSDLKAREADAAEVVDRNAHVAEEHALKVFDMKETLNARVIDLIDGRTTTPCAAKNSPFTTSSGGYPQVAAMSIVGGDGRLIATGRAYPAPYVSIATRDDKMFENVSRVMFGNLAGENVFNTAVPRKTPDGRFAGIVTIALRPSYFGAFSIASC